MKLLEYNLTHPYPHGKIFTITTVVLIVLVLPVLVLVNGMSYLENWGLTLTMLFSCHCRL